MLFCGEIQIDNKAVAAEKATWADIPVMTDFGADYIRRSIIANPDLYVYDQIRYELKTSGVLYPEHKHGKVELRKSNIDKKDLF